MSEILKLIAGGLLALVASYVGLLIKKRYKLREQFFADAKEYFVFFERELAFNKTPMPEINKKYLSGKGGEFADWLAQKDKNDKKGQSKKSLLFLKDAEKRQVENAIAGLGKSGYSEQVAYVKRWQADFEDKAIRCASENKKYGGMYFKLCVLIGIAVLILIA